MTPPPAMTTSALSTHHPPHLEDDFQGGKRRDVAVVEGRRDLDDVQPDQARRVRRRPEQLEGLSRRQTTGRGDLGARRKGGVQDVDVERNVDRMPVETIRDLPRR